MPRVRRVEPGHYPPPRHTVAHLSDPHLRAGAGRVFGEVDAEDGLVRALERLGRLVTPPQAIVFTGDLADLGEQEAYERLRDLVGPVAEDLDAELIWVMGNHDERADYSRILYGAESDEPQDRVHDVAGLRVVVLDSTIPGWHHGEITDDQLTWLGDVLAEPADHGTLLAMHHPPLPVAADPVSDAIQLDGQDRLAEALAGTDVRAILAGHLHYSTHSTFAGVPVSVASASCYTVDPAPQNCFYAGVDGNLALSVVHLYDEQAGGVPGAPVVHTTVPLAEADEVVAYAPDAAGALAKMTLAERRELLSRKGEAARRARREWRAQFDC